jgi:hypothetical protein
MLHLLQSLSFGQGGGIVVVLSTLLTWILGRLACNGKAWLSPLIWLIPVSVPLLVSYILYWSPVWMGSDDSAEYGAWAFRGL